MALWDNNHLQFCRLLSEIQAAGLNSRQYRALREAMDLQQEELDELFDRAEIEWQRAKRGQPVRSRTPAQELTDYQEGL